MKSTENTGFFADRLSDLISKAAQNGITLRDIEKATGVKKESISKYQNNKAEPGLNSIVALAKYFNVSSDYLLGLSDTSTTDITVQEICKRTGFDEDLIKFLQKGKGHTIKNQHNRARYFYCFPNDFSFFMNSFFKNEAFQTACWNTGCLISDISEASNATAIKEECLSPFVTDVEGFFCGESENGDGKIVLTRSEAIEHYINITERQLIKAFEEVTGFNRYQKLLEEERIRLRNKGGDNGNSN